MSVEISVGKLATAVGLLATLGGLVYAAEDRYMNASDFDEYIVEQQILDYEEEVLEIEDRIDVGISNEVDIRKKKRIELKLKTLREKLR